MKFLKTLALFCIFSLVAISIRLLVFGRPGQQIAPGSIPDQVAASPGEDLPAPQVTPPLAVQESSPGKEDPHQHPPRWEFEGVQVVGYVMRGRSINLWLSDGRFLTERDKELTEVRKNYAVIDGRRVWLQRIPPPASQGEVSGLKMLQDGQSGRADSQGTGPQRVASDAPQVVSPL